MASKKEQRQQAQIAELEIKKRNGMMRAVAAFVVLFVLIFIKTSLTSAGVEWANSQIANMGIFVIAIVAAGFCGIGTRDWNRARKALDAIYAKRK